MSLPVLFAFFAFSCHQSALSAHNFAIMSSNFEGFLHSDEESTSIYELWSSFLTITNGLEVPMTISLTARCIEILINATHPPLYIKAYLYHPSTVTEPFTYSKSLDFMSETDDLKKVGVPHNGLYLLQLHVLFNLRQGWAPQGAVREVMDRVFDIRLVVNQSNRIGCDGKFWLNGEWCPICRGKAEALVSDALLGFGQASYSDLSQKAEGTSTDALERFSRAGRILLVGTSRMRTVFYDLVELLGLAHDIDNMWHKAHHDLEAGGRIFFQWDLCEMNASSWIQRFDQEYPQWCPASRPWQPADIIFLSRGICYTLFNQWGDRHELQSELDEEHSRLQFLMQKCRAPHRLVYVLEAGVHSELSKHQEFKGLSAFNGARLALVNQEMLELHRSYGLPALDLFDPTASFFPNEGSEPYAHYYRCHSHGGLTHTGGERGGPASRASALLVLDWIAADRGATPRFPAPESRG